MSFGPQRPSGLAVDEEAPADRVPRPSGRLNIAESYERDHLCLGCVHASVCAVAASVRLLGADGQLVISKCAAYFEVTTSEAKAG